MPSDLELMRAHVEALFTHDADGRLVFVNEAQGAPAPRFFLGRTVDGAVRRFRHDVDADVVEALRAASDEALRSRHGFDSPTSASRYEEILARAAPVEKSGWFVNLARDAPATTGRRPGATPGSR